MDDATPFEPTRHRLNVFDLFRMLEVGIIPPGDRVELIDGAVIDMPPVGSEHALAVDHLEQLLAPACLDRAMVLVGQPIRLDRFNQPQPDLAICRRRADAYRSEYATPTDILLLIEVADGALDLDQAVRLPLYAGAGISEYWVVNLPNRTLLVHRRPAGAAYLDRQALTPPARIALNAAPSVSFDLTLPSTP